METNNNSQQIWKESIPKYYQLKQLLIEDIKKGVYSIDAKLPSQKELMRKYNVAIGTIDKTVNELVNDGFIYTIQGKGRFVSNPKKETEAISKNENNGILPYENKRIAFIFPDALNEFYTDILRGIIDVLQPKDYSIDIHAQDNNSSGSIYKNEMKLLGKYFERHIAGIIFIPYFYNHNYKHLFQLQKRGIPTVFVDRRVKAYDFDFITNDHFEASRQGVNYLIKQGHREIAFLERYGNVSSAKGVYEGYEEALKENGIKVNPDLVYLVKDPDNYIPNGKEAVKKIKEFLLSNKGKYTAIFAHCDVIAIICYKILRENGIRIPEDVSLISNGDSHFVQSYDVPLTVVKHDVYNMGYQAAKLLLKRIENKTTDLKPEEILLKTKIIARKSVKRIEIKKVRE